MSWRSLITHNPGWKLMSLFLATAAWFAYNSGGKIELQLREDFIRPGNRVDFIGQPIMVLRPSNDKNNYQLDVNEVDITVTGDSSTLKTLHRKQIQAMVNLTEIEDPTRPVKIQVEVPRGVTVQKVTPAEARIR